MSNYDIDLLGIIKAQNEKINDVNKKLDSVMFLLHNQNKSAIEDSQDAICESSTDTEQRLADIENALCELSESEVN